MDFKSAGIYLLFGLGVFVGVSLIISLGGIFDVLVKRLMFNVLELMVVMFGVIE